MTIKELTVMTEHVHEWGRTFYGDWVCNVRGCSGALTFPQVKSRLNATERLSANMARALCRGIHPNFKAAIKALTAYADTLEDE